MICKEENREMVNTSKYRKIPEFLYCEKTSKYDQLFLTELFEIIDGTNQTK